MVRETAKENQVALFGFFEGFTRSTPVVFLLIILPQLLASIIEGGPTDLNLGITLAILPLWLVLPLERRLSGKSKKCLGIILAYGGSVLLLLTGILYLVQWSVDDTPALTLVILTAACLSLLAFQDLDYFGMLEQVPRRRFSAVLGMGIAGLVFALIYLLTGTVAALFFVFAGLLIAYPLARERAFIQTSIQGSFSSETHPDAGISLHYLSILAVFLLYLAIFSHLVLFSNSGLLFWGLLGVPLGLFLPPPVFLQKFFPALAANLALFVCIALVFAPVVFTMWFPVFLLGWGVGLLFSLLWGEFSRAPAIGLKTHVWYFLWLGAIVGGLYLGHEIQYTIRDGTLAWVPLLIVAAIATMVVLTSIYVQRMLDRRNPDKNSWGGA